MDLNFFRVLSVSGVQGIALYTYVKLKVWILTINGLPAQSMDPYFERAIHGLSALSKD